MKNRNLGIVTVTLSETINHPTWGEINIDVEISVSGESSPATYMDPAEYPDFEITDVIVSDEECGHYGEQLPPSLWPDEIANMERRVNEALDEKAMDAFDSDDILEGGHQAYHKSGQYW